MNSLRWVVAVAIIEGAVCAQSSSSTTYSLKSSVDVLHFANVVQKRYYLIKRLQEPVALLLGYYEQICGCASGRECALEGELQRVKASWHECCSYKRIMSDAHIKELLAHLIVLFDALLRAVGNGGYQGRTVCDRGGDLDSLLDEIDCLTYATKRLSQPNQRFLETLNQALVIQDEHLFIGCHECVDEPEQELIDHVCSYHTDDDFLVATTGRFYIIQRLAPALDALNDLMRCNLFTNFAISNECSFHSPAVKACYEKMCMNRSIAPLVELWQHITSYRFIGDAQLIREMLLLAIKVYQVVIKMVSSDKESVVVNEAEVVDLYTTVASLPLPELLMVLDELAQQSTTVITAYQEGKMQGWKALAKHYWWVPPVVVAGSLSLYVRIKKMFMHPQYRLERLGRPARPQTNVG